MKKQDIVIGGIYTALVSGKLTTVRVDEVRIKTAYSPGHGSRQRVIYDVTNLATGRQTTFHSSQRFRAEAEAVEKVDGESAKPDKFANTLSSLLKARKEQQEAVASLPQPPHLIVIARAGTGKTTTLVEGLKRVKGIPSSLTPSPQQAAVWEQMELSKGVGSVCFVAFNKSIATELQARVPQGCDAMTMHSMGFKSVNKTFTGLRVNQFRTDDLIAKILGRDGRDLRRDEPVLLKATKELVGLCKMNLVHHWDNDSIRSLGLAFVAKLSELASHYEVDLNGSRDRVFELVPRVLETCKDPARDGCIDFDDMIWLPVVLDLPVYRYDLLLVDEAQDLNRCQQALAKRAGKRLILCGDPKQAIYGFAGADAESMPRMERELAGCVVLPLTVTRRCGKAIVREAQRLVPDFEAFETNPEGSVGEARYPSQGGGVNQRGEAVHATELPWEQTYAASAVAGDFILCRVNAPLVSQCFRFLKRGIKANIQGRDIGQGLISTVGKLKASSADDLVVKVEGWLERETAKEQARRNPSEAKLIALQDRADCLICFAEGASTVDEVIKKIQAIFTDDKQVVGIRLSSVHKAKGLEARRVFILQPKGATMPHPMAKSAWQREQEMNILYVAITRAIEELVYVY